MCAGRADANDLTCLKVDERATLYDERDGVLKHLLKQHLSSSAVAAFKPTHLSKDLSYLELGATNREEGGEPGESSFRLLHVINCYTI